MREYKDNLYKEENPSSIEGEREEKKKFELPEDPEAEKLIKSDALTTDDFIDTIFQGLDLKAYDGTPFTRKMLVTYLNSAIATAEMTFDIVITPREIKGELHDFEGESLFDNYQYTPLFKKPVMEVHKMVYKLGNRETFKVPMDWINLEKKLGEITLFPMSGTMNLVAPAYGAAVPFFMYRSFLPMAVEVDYKAGMKKEDIPYNLIEYLYKLASISVFDIWGDQIIGAGIASASISIDGLSQSTGTTQSAMYGGASARILEYRKDLETLAPIIRKYFARFDSVVL